MNEARSQNQPAPGRSFEAIKTSLSQKLLDVDSPFNFIITLIYCIPILAPIRTCVECSIFSKLAHAKRPLHAGELIAESESQAEDRIDFVVRILRAATALGLADEVSPRTYLANELTMLMADPALAAGFKLLFDNSMGPRSTMTEFVASSRSTSPTTATDGPWQRARGAIGESTFEHWAKHDPEQSTRLSQLMQRMQGETPHWTEWLPAEVLFDKSAQATVPFLVDVGGGRGHDISALAVRYPDRDLQLVLQDLPSVVQEGIEDRYQNGTTLDQRMTLSEHDFFQPQPIRGAAIYYLHKILHDWPDDDCVLILTRLRDAMDPTSRIFVNEVVLPDQGASLLCVALNRLRKAVMTRNPYADHRTGMRHSTSTCLPCTPAENATKQAGVSSLPGLKASRSRASGKIPRTLVRAS